MNFLTSFEFSALYLIKIATIVFLLLYLIFALLVIKQVKVMTETLQVGFENQIKALVFFHFLFAVLLLIIFIVFVL